MKKNVIEIENLKTYFDVSKGLFKAGKNVVKAVDDISFEIAQGKSLGLVGQSGCGKTTTARSITMLEEKTDGNIKFFDESQNKMTSIDDLSEDQIKNFRRNVQMIFQDPYEAMNPRWTIKDTILEPLIIHNIGTDKEQEEAVIEILKTVGLTPPENYLSRYPHELSGGQRQRVAIARALIMKPKFVICDEPTSMLDVSIRISIMDLMVSLAKDLNVSYLYITHDLAVARYMCDRIAVMYNGKIVELAETEELLKNPIHPYTKRLISSIPVPDPTYERKVYEITKQDLEEIENLSNNKDDLYEIGNKHFVSTHKIKGLL
tara:strand:+ start:5338 stop:6291 length:954 start_codon:yes stop_codon:yes gene_type:complete